MRAARFVARRAAGCADTDAANKSTRTKIRRAISLILRFAARVVDNAPLKNSIAAAVCYIIAVGGAGSSGEPAFLSGMTINNAPISAMTATPTRYEGLAKNSGSVQSRKLKVAITSPAN